MWPSRSPTLGRRAVAVGTDITDEEQVNNLVEASLNAYGRVDVLINNAFRVPSMKPLANTTFEHIRDAIELTVLGALRLIQGFTPALAEAKGSVVNVNSMVVRHSQAKYGAYKMAKSALLAMSQSLASELGPQGIRVNSVLPGYIWGGTLKGYFEHQAGKYGTTVDEIYKAAAVEQRPQAAAHRGRGGVGDPVHGQRPVQRHHRPGARRQLRGVQGLMRETSASGSQRGTSEDRSERESSHERDRRRHRRRPARLGHQGRAASTISAPTTTTTAKRSACCSSPIARDADLTELGSKMSRFFVRNALVARLLSEAAWKQYPQHADVPIERPIFVTGLPRTGTTALHRLLSADPRHQGLELWLAEFPQPRPPRETWSENPVFAAARRAVHQGARREPGLHGPALHDRRRGRGVLAAAAPVAAFGVLRDAGAPAHATPGGWPSRTGRGRISGTARTFS